MNQLTFASVDASFPNLPEDGREIVGGDVLFVRWMHFGGQSLQLIEAPTWKQIEAAVLALAGTNDMMLEGIGPYPSFPSLVIAGGTGGRYLVAAQQEGGVLVLSNPEPQDLSEFTVILGGQPSGHSAAHAVDLEAVFTAVRTFARHGTLARSQRWVEDL